MVPAEEALERLRAGNARFAAGAPRARAAGPALLRELAEGQRPFATILGCSDSRVPAEIVFDQDVGDLFVIRVAGNVAAPTQVGSIEFAAEALGVPLVVVLGHTGCGAVLATLEQPEVPSPNLRSITERIRPAIGSVGDAPGDGLADRAVEANVRATVAELTSTSEILRRLADTDDLLITGAVYSLSTGLVELLSAG